MHRLTAIIALAFAALVAVAAPFLPAHAQYGAALDGQDMGGWAVAVNPKAPNTTTFWCNNTKYYSDIPLESLHGCEVETVGFGPAGADATLLTVHHGWRELDGTRTPRTTTFLDLPDGTLFRLADTTFLASNRVDKFFHDLIGFVRPPHPLMTNITLERLSQKNLQLYGNTMCVEFHMKHPLTGIFGWCQGETVLGGEADYLKGALTFTRAALLAQSYIYDNNLPVPERKLITSATRIGLNQDKEGWLYYAFGVPGKTPDGREVLYGLRVYFNGQVKLTEYSRRDVPVDRL